jgi:DNA-binding response OmpR family regulator
MGNPKILSIDDDPEISSLLHARLAVYRIDVLRAFSGMQGFWTAVADQPMVIVSDLVMPDGQGDYVYTRMQSHPLTRDIPFIVFTGQGNSAIKRSLLSMGVAAYLQKPMDFSVLLKEVKRHIDVNDQHLDSLRFNVSRSSLTETTLHGREDSNR